MTMIKRSTTYEAFSTWAEAINWHRLFSREGEGQKNARYITPEGKQFYCKWDANGGLVDMVELHLVQNQTITQVITGRAFPTPAQRSAPSTSAANSRGSSAVPPGAPPASSPTHQDPPAKG